MRFVQVLRRASFPMCALALMAFVVGCGTSSETSQDLGGGSDSTTSLVASLTPVTLLQEPVSGSVAQLSELVAKVDLPDSGSVMVYRVKTTQVNEDTVRALANRLGVTGGACEETPESLYLRGDQATVTVDKVSGAVYYDTAALEGTGRPLEDVRDDGYYQAEAEKFLKDHDLWREDAVYAGISQETVTAADSQGHDRTQPLSIHVQFCSRPLNGLSWAGVGPKISVFFGEAGAVIGAAIYWPTVEPYKEYPTISGEEALANIMAGRGTIVMAETAESKGTVEKVELVYWCDPVGYPQRFVAPYYKMRGKTADGKEFTAYTRALPADLVVETLPPSPLQPVTTSPR